jgi:hypothetical protein
MSTLRKLENEVDSLVSKSESPSSEKSANTNPLTMKERAMNCLQPPYVYFICLFFAILFGLYYTKPCYVLSNDIDPKTRKQTINYKMLFAYALAITALISFGAYPYLTKK